MSVGRTTRGNRQRATTAFGWVAGGCAGLLCSYGLDFAYPSWPTTLGTFALFVAGAFMGMHIADRLGPKAFRLLGVTAGVFLTCALAVIATVAMGGR